MTDLSRLHEPFPREKVSWRIQGTPIKRGNDWIGMALAYIDARDVMDRLDEVCGPGGWQSEITETASGRVLCTLSIHTEGGWVRKTDGAGNTQVEAEKGGISDSLKRAAVQWGVGRYLYDIDAPWVPCEVNEKGGKTYWRKWLVDPWSKVKGAPNSKPEPARTEPNPPADGLDPAVVALVTSIYGAADLNALQALWKTHAKTKAAASPTAIAAKEAKKRQLQEIEGGEDPFGLPPLPEKASVEAPF